MNDLVEALLPLGYIPAIVPEFKGITVGGSIQGLAAESTSFRYGLYHDTVTGFEAVLANGSVLWCSPESNSDLFYGLPGSFGSLAICTRAEVVCIPTKSHVKVITKRHDSHRQCVKYMSGIMDQAEHDDLIQQEQAIAIDSDAADLGPPVPLFMEGIGYSADEFLSIEGYLVSETEASDAGLKVKTCNTQGSRWFYNMARQYHFKHHKEQADNWGSVGTPRHPSVDGEVKANLNAIRDSIKQPRVGPTGSSGKLEDNPSASAVSATIDEREETAETAETEEQGEEQGEEQAEEQGQRDVSEEEEVETGGDRPPAEGRTERCCFAMPIRDYLFRHDRGSFWMASYRIPQVIGRYVMGDLLDSSRMFQLADALPWAFPKNIIVLQDFMLPIDRINSFVDSMQKQLEIWPVWLLPMRNRITDPEHNAIFSMPAVLGGGPKSNFCNVGVYGIPGREYDFIPANERLERLLWERGGRKVHYSHSFYDEEVFYRDLYDGQRYRALREKYCPDGALPDVYSKIVTKNGKL